MLLLVTGRKLDELLQVFPSVEAIHVVVAENGALIYRPDTKAIRVLTEPPPDRFVTELNRRGVTPLSVGRTIVAVGYG